MLYIIIKNYEIIISDFHLLPEGGRMQRSGRYKECLQYSSDTRGKYNNDDRCLHRQVYIAFTLPNNY